MKKYKVFWIFLTCAALALASLLVQNNYLIILADQIIISIIVLMGLNFVTSMMGQMNLGTAGIMALGAYTSALLCTKLSMSSWLSLLFVILMGIAIGIIIGYPSLRIKGIYLALTTLGFSEIVRILVTNLMDLTGGPSGVRAIPGFTFFGLQINSAHSYLFLFMAILFVLLVLTVYITNSKWGRAIKAVANNELAVEACGICLSTVKVFAFTLCCVYGCIGGALYAHLIGYISPSDFSMKLTIKYLMMLMVGGIGSTGGNVLGAVLVTLLPELLRKFDNYYWLIFSAFMLIMAIFNPYGLLEIVRKITRYFRDKTGKKAEKNG